MKIDSAKSQQSTNVENTDSVVAMSEVRVLSIEKGAWDSCLNAKYWQIFASWLPYSKVEVTYAIISQHKTH